MARATHVLGERVCARLEARSLPDDEVSWEAAPLVVFVPDPDCGCEEPVMLPEVGVLLQLSLRRPGCTPSMARMTLPLEALLVEGNVEELVDELWDDLVVAYLDLQLDETEGA